MFARILFLVGNATAAAAREKKNGWTRPLNFDEQNLVGRVSHALATLAPFLVRFMTQSDTMAHGTDHKTWETTLSPGGSGTVPGRNHRVPVLLPLFFHPRLSNTLTSTIPRPLSKAGKNYCVEVERSRAELIIPPLIADDNSCYCHFAG